MYQLLGVARSIHKLISFFALSGLVQTLKDKQPELDSLLKTILTYSIAESTQLIDCIVKNDKPDHSDLECGKFGIDDADGQN